MPTTKEKLTTTPASRPKKSAGHSQVQTEPVHLPPVEVETVTCTVLSPEAGFYLLVDGELAFDQNGQWLKTPCTVQLTPGTHLLTIAKKNYVDSTQEIVAAEGRKFDLPASYEPFAAVSGFFASKIATLPVGEPHPLQVLNTDGPVWDPFVSADGRKIWFAGQRAAGKGIYVASREHWFDEFGEPEFISATRSADKVGSPTVTADGQQLYFCSLGKARIWHVPLTEERIEKQPVKATDEDGVEWPATFVSGDGLMLYCLSHSGQDWLGKAWQRRKVEDPFSERELKVNLRQGPPVISADGLRLYLYDGQTLSRAARRDRTDDFAPAEELLKLSLKNYHAVPGRRQFWVSDDEQWLYTTDDPEKSGNLSITRIADQPAWKYVPRGKPLSPKLLADRKSRDDAESMPEEKSAAEKAAATAPDPRNQPLAYVVYRQQLEPLLAVWQFDAAAELVEQSLKNPDLARDQELLQWDQQEIAQLQSFWQQLVEIVQKLEPGTPIRLAGAQLEFVKYEEGKIHAKSKTKELIKALDDCAPADLVSILEKHVPMVTPGLHWQIGLFLSTTPARVNPNTVNQRFQKAGVDGRETMQRPARRRLHLIEQEMARSNIGPALMLVDELVAIAPQSESATAALRLKADLPLRIKWRAIGNQKWDLRTPGLFATGTETATDSYLTCDEKFTNFALSLEWKSVGPAAQGGVFFRYNGRGDFRTSAFKVHLANDASLRDQPDRFSTGALLGVQAPKANAVLDEGQWNQLQMRVEGDRVTAKINGRDVLDTTLINDKLDRTGYVCLDGAFPGMTYRNVLLYELARPSEKTNSKSKAAEKKMSASTD